MAEDLKCKDCNAPITSGSLCGSCAAAEAQRIRQRPPEPS